MKRMGTTLNEWGVPVTEKPVVKPSLNEGEKYRLEESEKEESALSKLRAIELRMNQLHHPLLDERVSVELMKVWNGEAHFLIHIHPADLSPLVEQVRKRSLDLSQNFETELAGVGPLFEKKLKAVLSESLCLTGQYSGIQIRLDEYPKTEAEFKEAQFLVELRLSFDQEMNEQTIERAISAAIQSKEIYGRV